MFYNQFVLITTFEHFSVQFQNREVTKVNDLQADYFNLEHNPYLTNAEREAIVKRKEELRLLSLKAKRDIVVDIDVASGAIQEKKAIYDILKEITPFIVH